MISATAISPAAIATPFGRPMPKKSGMNPVEIT